MATRSTWVRSSGVGLPANICVAVLDEPDNRVIVVGGADAAHDTGVVVWGSNAGWMAPPRSA